jgi:hypothetical protein
MSSDESDNRLSAPASPTAENELVGLAEYRSVFGRSSRTGVVGQVDAVFKSMKA